MVEVSSDVHRLRHLVNLPTGFYFILSQKVALQLSRLSQEFYTRLFCDTVQPSSSVHAVEHIAKERPKLFKILSQNLHSWSVLKPLPGFKLAPTTKFWDVEIENEFGALACMACCIDCTV